MFMRASIRNAARDVAWCFRRNFSGLSHDDCLGLAPHNRTKALFNDLVQLPGCSELRLVKFLGSGHPDKVADFVGLNRLPDQVRRTWAGVFAAPNFDTMLNVFKKFNDDILASSPYAVLKDSQLPGLSTVLLLHILLHRTATTEELSRSIALLLTLLSTSPISLQPILLISATSKAAELRLLAILRPLVDSFSKLENTTVTHYRLLLRALSLAPRSRETNRLILSLISAMSAKGHRLEKKEVYDALLRPSVLTVELADGVLKRAGVERIKLSSRHLQSLLRLYSIRAHKRRALQYLNLLGFSSASSLLDARGPRLSHHNTAARWRSMFMIVFRDITAANRYLRRVSVFSSTAIPTPGFVPANTSESGDMSNLGTSPHHREDAHTANTLSHSSQSPTLTPSTDTVQQCNSLIHPAANSRTLQWLSTLRVASKDPKLSARALFIIFRKGGLRYTHSLSGYEVVIHGLLRKKGFTPALTLWRELRDGGWSLGSKTVGVGVRALASANQSREAFALLEEAHAKYRARWSWEPGANQVKPKSVGAGSINQFMVVLRRKGRPDVVFALWEAMGVLYGASPDVYTLNIMLGTARWARKYDQSVRGAFRSALAEIGLNRSQHTILEGTQYASRKEIRGHAVSYLESILDPGNAPRLTGQWGSEPASTAALRIAVRVFLGNWPQLRTIRPPVHTARRSPSDPATSPLLDLFHTLSNPSDDDGYPTPLLHLLPKDTPEYPYPYIYPTDVTFRAVFDLLACEMLQTEIPVVLAWMRALHVRPSKRTLATALVHYTEVGMDAPLIEKFKGGPSRSPYSMLMSWMRGWVGEKNMPTRWDMSDEMDRLAFYRHARYDDKYGFVTRDAHGRPIKRQLRKTPSRTDSDRNRI